MDRANIQKVQTGYEWESQFNVEHNKTLENQGSNSVSAQELKRELDSLQQLSWETVNLPHTAYREPYTIVEPWQGICYYQKDFTIDKNEKGGKTFILFEGAMQQADVWVNGKHILQHAGGYTPFTADITEVAKFDDLNTILVRLDNRNNPLIPPGKPLENLDFCYHSGIYRNVFLIHKNLTYITDPVHAQQKAGGGVFVTFPEVSDKLASVDVKVHVKNENNKTVRCKLIHQLLDIHGRVKARTQSDGFELKQASDKHHSSILQVEDPALWSPDNPNLYSLKTELWVDGKITEKVHTKIGIRHIEISRQKGFVLNGSPTRLVGTNRHMEYPFIGNALPANAQYRDLYKIKMAGFNVVRLGHYPQDPSVLDACDELGLLVIEPIPGWQYFNSNELFMERTYRDIRDIIRRDRNHPSIMIWETILNESWPPDEWKDKAHQTAHEEYPGDQCFTGGDMYGYYGWDVLYNDWKEDITRPNDSKKPGFIREYGDYEFGGHYSTTRQSRKDGENGLLQNAWNFQWSHNRYRKQYPWTMGDANWDMYDYNRGCCDNICYSGISELNRIPKFSYYFFQSQMDIGTPLPDGPKKPMVYIANWWTKRDTGKVVVYGNVDEVELLINGEVFARNTPDSGPDTPYENGKANRINGGTPFDGGNGNFLKHPPFTFTDVPWAAGELKAVGYVNKIKVMEQSISTPGKPHGIRLTIDESGRKTGSNDVIFVYAEVIDGKGNLCVDYSSPITLSIKGECKILSPKTVRSEAGIAAFLLNTGMNFREIILEAVCEDGKLISEKIKILH